MKIVSNKCIFVFICVIVVVSLLSIGYFITKNSLQRNLLKDEIMEFINKDLLSDSYEVEIKTSGDYAYIEEKVKNYYKSLSNNIKIVNGYLSDENLIQILSVDNLLNDRPDFLNSYKVIEDTRSNYETALKNIINLCSEDTIKKLVDKKKVNKYAYNLYLELIYNKENLKDLNNIQGEIRIICEDLGIFLDKVDLVFNLLEDNIDYWYIEDGQLYFKTNDLVNQYNNLYDDLKKFVSDKFSKYDIEINDNKDNNV